MAGKNSNSEGHYIFRKWRTDKNGNRIYAKTYGKKAFKIWIPENQKTSLNGFSIIFGNAPLPVTSD